MQPSTPTIKQKPEASDTLQANLGTATRASLQKRMQISDLQQKRGIAEYFAIEVDSNQAKQPTPELDC
jgi:hypothetical protein